MYSDIYFRSIKIASKIITLFVKHIFYNTIIKTNQMCKDQLPNGQQFTDLSLYTAVRFYVSSFIFLLTKT